MRASYSAYQRHQRRFMSLEAEEVPPGEEEEEEEKQEVPPPAGPDEVGGGGGEEEEVMEERICLNLIPSDSNCLHPEGPLLPAEVDGGDDNDAEHRDEFGEVCDPSFCPVCTFNFRRGDNTVMTELFRRMAEYGQWNYQDYAKGISVFYHQNVRYQFVPSAGDQKPWHWKSVLNHMRSHDSQPFVHAHDQLSALRHVISIAACSMATVSKSEAEALRRAHPSREELNRALIRAAVLEKGGIKAYKDLIELYTKLDANLRRCRDQELQNIAVEHNRRQSLNQDSRKAKKRRTGAAPSAEQGGGGGGTTLHRDAVAEFISSRF